MPSVSFFVSPHGFGHASRAAAVMEALCHRVPHYRLNIHTTVPRWYFEQSLDQFTYCELLCDIGMAQQDALTTDLPGTLERLSTFYPFDPEALNREAHRLHDIDCRAVVSDISPLGIAIAKAADLPVILIENFTWDWIYRGYESRAPEIARHADAFGALYDSVDLHIQTTPLCHARPSSVKVAPIWRPARNGRERTRQQLGLDRNDRMVFISMGGIAQDYPFLRQLASWPAYRFVVAGTDVSRGLPNNLITMPSRTDIYHPDVVRASDLVIGKAGYSTIAEVYGNGARFGFFSRPDYPEMPPLASFIEEHRLGKEIPATCFHSGEWLNDLDALASTPPNLHVSRENGADRCAELIAEIL